MSEQQESGEQVVLLCGGVGGAKLAEGLAQLLPPGRLSVVVNTGDDFQHLGLHVSPDMDTVTYTLADVVNREYGWGRDDESWRTMAHVAELGGPSWFRLGDRDLGTHLVRTHLLAQGERLTAVTTYLLRQFGVPHAVLPMSDAPAPTRVRTPSGILGFQEWFVREQWQPPALEIVLPDDARATPDVVRALAAAEIVIIGPSNPFVSIEPILNCYPVRPTIADEPGVVVAVSPIVGGDAVKGPTAKMMRERNLPVSPVTVADLYGELLDGYVYDRRDGEPFGADAGPLLCTDTMMPTLQERRRLAGEILEFARQLLRGED